MPEWPVLWSWLWGWGWTFWGGLAASCGPDLRHIAAHGGTENDEMEDWDGRLDADRRRQPVGEDSGQAVRSWAARFLLASSAFDETKNGPNAEPAQTTLQSKLMKPRRWVIRSCLLTLMRPKMASNTLVSTPPANIRFLSTTSESALVARPGKVAGANPLSPLGHASPTTESLVTRPTRPSLAFSKPECWSTEEIGWRNLQRPVAPTQRQHVEMVGHDCGSRAGVAAETVCSQSVNGLAANDNGWGPA
jgi:hypothetical protein